TPGIEVVVDVYGDMSVLPRHKLHKYKGPRWVSVEFEGDEVKRAWPKPHPPAAREWMLKEAKRLAGSGKAAKRDDMVRRCRDEIGCTKRAAEAAYKTLPDGMRRPRGRPPKDPG